ncbi:serine/threonine-protein kinase [Hyalangium versicolor]|uniref:serine/threonine-protein kinase n=1 Tax=Hyalangium versicolor TaxID=2861190 RepID=UPI001CCD2388|nr:serine/threonine-protein kinase [Hyalangium versicolor]
MVGPWRVLARVDSGSHGVVFRAQRADHPESPSVALKLARQVGDPRFEREAALLQRVQHPGVPRYEDSGLWTSPEGDRYPYVVMEWVEGSTLYEWFREQPRSSREVLRMLAQVARSIEAVHAEGAFHRDVKGDNVRVTPEGRAVLVDFGASWLPGARPLTDTAAPPGTTPYRAPELLRFMWHFRRDAEARWHSRPSDDLYALGVTAYRLVTGTYLPPVTEDDEAPGKLVPPRELATVAPELESIILRLLSEACDARGTAAEIAQALEQAEQRAGPDADKPIRLTLAATRTERGAPHFSSSSEPPRRPSHPRPSPNRRRVTRATFLWFTWASAALAGGLLPLTVLKLWPSGENHSVDLPPLVEESHAPPVEAPDAGVGDEALASTQNFPRVGVPPSALGRPMPKQPYPGQRKPPCSARGERSINGGCWVIVGAEERPPCGPTMFDHEDRCYYASYDAPRQPASSDP